MYIVVHSLISSNTIVEVPLFSYYTLLPTIVPLLGVPAGAKSGEYCGYGTSVTLYCDK